MADLGRISGPMLKDNLLRGGVDLVFENRLGDNNLYLDVNTTKIGINTDSITRELTINDSVKTDNLIVDNSFTSENVRIEPSSIESLFGDLVFNPASGIVNLSSISTYGIKIQDNVIQSLNSNETIELRPNGSGDVNFTTTELDIDGNLHTTGDITLDGTITIGNSDTDSVSFASDIDSDIIPDINETFDLGSTSKKWLGVYTEFVNGQLLETSGISVSGVNSISLRQGNIWYVAVNGLDTNVGDHQNGPFLTIKHALENANGGDTVYIYPGEYQEEFPLTVPDGVTVRGAGIRAVKITPTVLTQTKDAFLLHGDTTVSDLTVADFHYDSSLNTGYGFRFAPNYTIPSRSPYVQNISVITQDVAGSSTPTDITAGPSPTGISLTSNSVTLSKSFYSQPLVDSLVGQLAVIDRYPAAPLIYTVVSIETEPLSPTEWRMTVDTTFNPAGQLKPVSFYPDVGTTLIVTNDIWDTSGSSVGEKWVAYFKTNLPLNFETTVGPGWTINVAGTIYIVDYIIEDPVNTNQWRIYVTTTLVGGVGIPIFSSPIVGPTLSAGRGALVDGAYANTATTDLTSISTDNIFVTVNGEQIVTSYGEASMLFNSVTFIVPNAIGLYATNGVRIEWLNSFTYFASKGLYAVNGVEGRISIDGSSVKYGAEIRSIGSANVYGQVGAEADGNQTLMYLINHNFAYIGSGLDSTNDPSNVVQANETVELNSGKIYYQSLDHKGTYRVGDVFVVDLETGEISIDGVSTSFGGITALNFVDEDSETLINASTVDANNIRISGNTISSIAGDVNITAQSNQIDLTQNINISKNLDISNDFIIKGQLTVGNQTVDTVNFVSKLDEDLIPKVDNTYSIGSNLLKWDAANIENIELDNLKFFDNRIKTIDTNSDLELTAQGTGRIYASVTDIEIDQSLTVNGTTNLKNTNILGTVTHTGNIVQAGNSFQTGDYNLTGSLSVSNDFFTEDIAFIDNRVTTQNSNSDLDLRAAGTGRIYVPSDNVQIDQNLTVVGLTSTTNITNSNTVTSDQFYVDDILIKDNYITTYNLNSNLELFANNAGGVFLETLRFTDNTISTVSGNTNISIATLSAGSVLINDEKALKIPAGTGSARPTGIQGDFRYDLSDNLFSGWSSNRVTFGGVFSADRRTNVTAHPTNNTLNFIANLVPTMTISESGISFNGLGTDNTMLFNGNIISSLTANTDINLSPDGTGQTDLGNFHIYQNEFINQLNTPLTLVTTAGGHVKFNGTKAVQIPFGPSDERPFTEVGDIRWNTDNNATEIFDGVNYVSIAGVTESASPEQVQELNEIYAILLG
jgi:hypothetical protein